MSQTIDVTGLPPEAVLAVEVLVSVLRGEAKPGGEIPSRYWPDGPRDEATRKWVQQFQAWAERHPVRETMIDDDRGSIYDRSRE